MTGGILALALLIPTAPPAGLQKGDELTFTGTIEEAVDRPGKRFRRAHTLEIRVLVLEKKDAWADVAVLTLLRRTDDAVTTAAGAITGGTPEKAAPPGARLDFVRVHADGTAHHLLPVGPPPLAFDAKTPARTLPPIPLDSFAPFELGMFPPRPPRSAPDKPWNTASADQTRPAEIWQAQGTGFVTAERCGILVMNQHSATWAKPVGGTTAWHRADAVWVSALDGTARKVHRVIRQRDGLGIELAAWVEVKYQLKDQTRVIGRTFDRYRRDVETAFATAADVAPFLRNPVKHGRKFFELRVQKLDAYLDDADASSPYREALMAVRRQIDAASRGESSSALAPGMLATPPKRAIWPTAGNLAPDFTAGDFRLANSRGKPVVLVFFRPGSETTDLSLAIADALHTKYGTRATVVPLAVWGDVAAGLKDRDRRKFKVPVYDGAQAATEYGVESVPRFVVIDGRGVTRWTFAGVGAETGYSTREQLDRLLIPVPPAGLTGTTRAPEPKTLNPMPRR